MDFSINKMKFHLSFLFPALIGFFVISDHIGLVPILLVSVAIHELAHICILYLLKNKIVKISFTALGISIKADTYFKKWWYEIILHFAGPFANLTLGIIFFLNGNHIIFALVNIVMGLFNLLPIGNLDGGNILKVLLRVYFFEKQDKIKQIINYIICIPMLLIGIIVFVEQKGNFTLIFLAISMIRTLET
ncbi:MAG: site-2 protease family protein [Oscillospiraceae bacterium]